MTIPLYEAANWTKAKDRLLEGRDLTHNQNGTVNTTKKRMMETILDNTRKSIMESASAGATNSGNVAQLNKVILPVIRRVMPTVIANEIIGVQPMTGPVAQIHTLRVKYANTIPSGGGGVTAGAEALSPFDIARYYAGNQNVATPGGGLTANIEGTMGNQISIETLRQTVTATSRRLGARWTAESAQDAQAQQGLDIEAEIMAALAQEITAEIDQEILFALRALPGSPTLIFDQSAVTGTPTSIVDVHAALAVMINRQANLIASRTRRGAGNWTVLSPTMLTVLQSGSASAFVRTTEGTFEAPTNTKFAGTLNNSMRIYIDQYAGDATPVMVGYKGTETDAPMYYCPYIPLTSAGTLMDPNTGEFVTSFLSRYGLVALSNSASSLGNAADYLGLIGVANANLTFM